MSKPRIPNSHKIQFIYSDEQWRRLERLCELSERTSKVDADREAQRVYEHILEAVLEGKRVLVEDTATGERVELLTTDMMSLRLKVERGEADHFRRPPS